MIWKWCNSDFKTSSGGSTLMSVSDRFTNLKTLPLAIKVWCCDFTFQPSFHSGTSCVSRVRSRQVAAAFRAALNLPCTWPWWPVGRGWRRLSPWSSLLCFSAPSASACTSSLKMSCTPASRKSWVWRSVTSPADVLPLTVNDPEIVCWCDTFVPVGVVAWFYSCQVQPHGLLHQLPQWERSRVEETFQTLRLSEALLTCEFLKEGREDTLEFSQDET